MIAKSLFFRCQKIYFIYFILFICLYLNISYDGEIFIYFIMNFTHLLICHGILLIFCRIFPYENIPFTIFLNFISLFLVFLPLIFTIRELIDSYYIESIINLFLILIPIGDIFIAAGDRLQYIKQQTEAMAQSKFLPTKLKTGLNDVLNSRMLKSSTVLQHELN
ncbi:iron-regulated protein FrpA [Neisseria meningitidis]|nr:iron-regulated protein FrpA [Neisseria meningitidis]CWR17472.1 iron-regulated protein FrpA [Neisseria meningitidis]